MCRHLSVLCTALLLGWATLLPGGSTTAPAVAASPSVTLNLYVPARELSASMQCPIVVEIENHSDQVIEVAPTPVRRSTEQANRETWALDICHRIRMDDAGYGGFSHMALVSAKIGPRESGFVKIVVQGGALIKPDHSVVVVLRKTGFSDIKSAPVDADSLRVLQ